MMHRNLPAVLAAAFALAAPGLAQLTVMSVEPGINAGNVGPLDDIVLSFDRALGQAALPPTSDDINVFGKGTGPAAGTWSLENGGMTARFTPSAPFAAGEVVQVSLCNELTALDSSTLRSAGYHFEYRVRTRPNTLDFTNIGTMTVRSTPSQGVRVYGGQATDLDDDGWLDLAIVNQDTSDIRVFKSRADGTGTFDPFLTPVTETGNTPSPNESCDMNGDGTIDIVTADKFGDTVTVLIGNGDGTFAQPVSYPMGDLPRGLAVFDMNGDGHQDVICTNANSGNLSMRLNNGDGTLGAEVNMEGGGSTEWGLGAGDMNNDGIMDLVVGAQSSQRLVVWLGDGAGGFTQAGVLNGADRIWMIVLGDVNGDGNLDVSTGNGTSATGTIAFGDGQGGLTLGQISPGGSLVVATDLGDLDGDGDLDWILSAYGGSRWTLYENDGAGNFTQLTIFNASENPACAVMLDFDRDEDLDLALLDEIADEIVLMENTSAGVPFCNAVPNSTGFVATVTWSGSRNVNANEFAVHAAPIVPDSFGFYFYGQVGSAGTMQGNGILCLASPVFRSPVATAVGGVLSVPFDFTNPPSQAGAITAGSTWNFQAVYRDVPAGGALFNWSEALNLGFN